MRIGTWSRIGLRSACWRRPPSRAGTGPRTMQLRRMSARGRQGVPPARGQPEVRRGQAGRVVSPPRRGASPRAWASCSGTAWTRRATGCGGAACGARARHRVLPAAAAPRRDRGHALARRLERALARPRKRSTAAEPRLKAATLALARRDWRLRWSLTTGERGASEPRAWAPHRTDTPSMSERARSPR